MMTSSNGNILRATGPLCGEFTGPSEFPTQRPVTRSFVVFFDLRRNKRLSKQPWGWRFETPSRSLWRHRNEEAGYVVVRMTQTVPKSWSLKVNISLRRGLFTLFQTCHDQLRIMYIYFTPNKKSERLGEYRRITSSENVYVVILPYQSRTHFLYRQQMFIYFNSVRPSEAIWRQISYSTFSGVVPDATKPLPEPRMIYYR